MPRRNWLHRLVNFAVAVAVLAVAAGMFFFSYPGVHAIARLGGVSGQLARFYPALFDAVLVIACVAAVMLRDARWWARCWAWLVAIVVLGAIGTTDVLHAMSYGLRQRPTEGVVAAAPVAAVLLAFSLFLTMLRQSRPQSPDAALGPLPDQGRADATAAEQPTAPMMFSAVETVPFPAGGVVPRPPAPPIALPAGPAMIAEPPEAAPTQEIPAFATDADQGPDTAPDGEETAPTAAGADETVAAETVAADTVAAETVDSERPPTDQDEAVDLEAPTAAVASEPTAESTPESAPEPPAETADEPDQPDPQPAGAPAPAPPTIRYASSAAAEQFGDEDWEAEVDPALAGQVYPVLTSDPDIEVPSHQPGQSQDLEDDAPPFATAPFASVPRLNRVRVTPTPPTDDDSEE